MSILYIISVKFSPRRNMSWFRWIFAECYAWKYSCLFSPPPFPSINMHFIYVSMKFHHSWNVIHNYVDHFRPFHFICFLCFASFFIKIELIRWGVRWRLIIGALSLWWSLSQRSFVSSISRANSFCLQAVKPPARTIEFSCYSFY